MIYQNIKIKSINFDKFIQKNEQMCYTIEKDKKGIKNMIRIMFVCLGNICRSPMAEFVLKYMVKKEELENHFFISSSATSYEEIGNDIHYGTRNKLTKEGIPFTKREAKRLQKEDYDNYDFILGMEESNIRNIKRIVGNDKENKVYRLLDFSKYPRDIADPWYTENFDVTYNDIVEGCEGFIKYLKEKDFKI